MKVRFNIESHCISLPYFKSKYYTMSTTATSSFRVLLIWISCPFLMFQLSILLRRCNMYQNILMFLFAHHILGLRCRCLWWRLLPAVEGNCGRQAGPMDVGQRLPLREDWYTNQRERSDITYF